MAALSTLIADYQRRLVAVPRLASAQLAAEVVTRTPVDTGAMRRSWTPAINTIDGSSRGGDIAATANRLQPGDSFSLASGLKYARPLEYGWSAQAATGMVRVSVVRWQSITDASVRSQL